MPRDDRGFLKPDALMQGIPDQYAVQKGDVMHTVSLIHDRMQGGYVMQHISLDLQSQVREIHAWQVGDRLPLAQSLFRKEVRALGGRA